jgi:hypothetical protein
VVAAGAVAQTRTGRSALRQLGLYPAPTPFTELYLASPRSVLSAVARRRKISRQQVDFVIRNEQHHARIYSWAVQSATGQAEPAGNLTLGSGQQKTVKTRVRFRCEGSRTKVTISLLQPAQSIFWWVRCYG